MDELENITNTVTPEVLEEVAEVVEEKREVLTLPEKKEEDFTEVDGIKYPKNVIERAKSEGWTDRDHLKSRGKEDIYIDPQTFLDRGEKFVPFLNKKVEKKDKEISLLKKMLQKKFADDTKDKIDNVKTQIKTAKEYGEVDNIESLIEKRTKLETELSGYREEEVPPVAPLQPQKPIEMINWETENSWCFDTKNPHSVAKTTEATRLLLDISKKRPDLSLQKRFDLVDYNLKDFDNKVRQKANVSPPIQSQSTGIISTTNKKTIENLTSSMRRIFDDICVGSDGEQFKGKALENAKSSFLGSCEDKHFKK